MSIPNKITYICKELVKINNRLMYPAIAVSTSSESLKITAIKSITQFDKDKKFYEFDYDNSELSNVKLISFPDASYKVHFKIDGKIFYVDMFKDVLLECIENSGIRKGGYFNSKFIWFRQDSTIKIIRVGSDLYNSTKIQQSPIAPIQLSKLRPGYLYKDDHGNTSIFLGKVKTVKTINNNFNITRENLDRLLWITVPPETRNIRNYLKDYYHKITSFRYFKLTRANTHTYELGQYLKTISLSRLQQRLQKFAEIEFNKSYYNSEDNAQNLTRVLAYSEILNFAEKEYIFCQYLDNYLKSKNWKRYEFICTS